MFRWAEDVIILNSATALLFIIMVLCAIFVHMEFKSQDIACSLSFLKTLAFQNFFRR